MAEWNGIPLQKAILVRHEERGALLSDTDKSARDAVSYVARDGKYADRGDIDREPTRSDEEAMRRDAAAGAARAVDYAAREGDFAGKGEGRQVDASLWDERGPVSRGEAVRSMTESGAYMQSIVTVDRRYAEELGLSTKEDMQRLLRATWRENVREWGLFEHPEDVRWVAAYHTDAKNSLHCHVYTWGRPGDLEPGDCVSREGTRAGKAVILREGYERIRLDRDERATFIRDLSRQNIARQLDGRVDERMVAKLHAKAEERGWPERVPGKRDWDPAANPDVARLREKLEARLKEGRGSLSRDWGGGAVARDLVRAVEKASPATRAIADASRELAEQRADIHGYGDGFKDREKMIRKAREDYMSRLLPTVERAHRPQKVRDRARGRGDADRRDAQSRRDGMRRDGPTPLNMPRGDAKRGERVLREDYRRLTAKYRGIGELSRQGGYLRYEDADAKLRDRCRDWARDAAACGWYKGPAAAAAGDAREKDVERLARTVYRRAFGYAARSEEAGEQYRERRGMDMPRGDRRASERIDSCDYRRLTASYRKLADAVRRSGAAGFDTAPDEVRSKCREWARDAVGSRWYGVREKGGALRTDGFGDRDVESLARTAFDNAKGFSEREPFDHDRHGQADGDRRSAASSAGQAAGAALSGIGALFAGAGSGGGRAAGRSNGGGRKRGKSRGYERPLDPRDRGGSMDR